MLAENMCWRALILLLHLRTCPFRCFDKAHGEEHGKIDKEISAAPLLVPRRTDVGSQGNSSLLVNHADTGMEDACIRTMDDCDEQDRQDHPESEVAEAVGMSRHRDGDHGDH